MAAVESGGGGSLDLAGHAAHAGAPHHLAAHQPWIDVWLSLTGHGGAAGDKQVSAFGTLPTCHGKAFLNLVSKAGSKDRLTALGWPAMVGCWCLRQCRTRRLSSASKGSRIQ